MGGNSQAPIVPSSTVGVSSRRLAHDDQWSNDDEDDLSPVTPFAFWTADAMNKMMNDELLNSFHYNAMSKQ